MQLWQLDIVFGPRLVDTGTGEVREARIVTGLDDHSRYCVLARVVERATGRAGCLAFSEALARYGAPDEVLSDNGIQFTARFARGGAVRQDLPAQRDRAPAHAAALADHYREDRALPSDAAARAARRRAPVHVAAAGPGRRR